jgi:uncharacterized membrane protein YkoI
MAGGFLMTREPFTLRPWRRLPFVVLLVLLVGLVAALTSRADEGEGHDAIHEAIEAGEIVPLRQLFAKIRRDVQGRILKVELERERHAEEAIWVYEAKILTPEGHVLELEYDAKSLELLEIEGWHDDDDSQELSP